MHPETPKVQLRELVAAVRAHVEHDAENGIDGYERSIAEDTATPPPAVQSPPASVAGKPADAVKILAPSGDLFVSPGLARADSLEALRAELGDCQRCKLAGHRTNIVFGVGDPHAEIAFVGEGPGRDEDLQAEPFVGRAGKLLTEIITKGMHLRREDVYIANVVKCRPPGNRNPEPDEVASCESFLRRQIELIQPKVLVALGTFAAQALLRTRTPITRLRGQWQDYHGIRVMPTFHPAYLLRNPQEKKRVWEDIKAVMRELGLRPEVQ
jgi:uracil-DNA glycosylase family 4